MTSIPITIETTKINISIDKSKLQTKSKFIHAQRLQKLKDQLSNLNNFLPSPFNRNTELISFEIPKKQSQESDFINTSTQTQTIISCNTNKANYLQKVNQKTIKNENAILYRKISDIFKRQSIVLKKDNNKQRRTKSMLINYEEYLSQASPKTPFSSDLSQQMQRNRATRSLLKDKQIRNQNENLLKRIINSKPTISTKKLLNQHKKSKQLVRKIMRFNTIQKRLQQQQYLQPQIKSKHSFKITQQTQQNKKKSQSNISQQLNEWNNLSSPKHHKRSISSSNCSKKQIFQRTLSPLRCNHQNLSKVKQLKRAHTLQDTDVKTFIHIQEKMNNTITSKTNTIIHSKYFSRQRKPKTYLNQNNKKDNNIIVLGQISQKIKNFQISFKFLRYNNHYQIQIYQLQVIKKQPIRQKILISSPKSLKNSLSPLSHKVLSSIIQLTQDQGSTIFSLFDYDYRQIVCRVLQFYFDSNKLQVRINQDFVNTLEQKRKPSKIQEEENDHQID